jgi:hypothetical protein
MQDELVLADSAGHTMIDIEAVRTADRAWRHEAAPEEEDSEEDDAPEE